MLRSHFMCEGPPSVVGQLIKDARARRSSSISGAVYDRAATAYSEINDQHDNVSRGEKDRQDMEACPDLAAGLIDPGIANPGAFLSCLVDRDLLRISSGGGWRRKTASTFSLSYRYRLLLPMLLVGSSSAGALLPGQCTQRSTTNC